MKFFIKKGRIRIIWRYKRLDTSMRENDLLGRTFNFGIDCIKFLRELPNNQEYYVIKNQLIKSCTSIVLALIMKNHKPVLRKQISGIRLELLCVKLVNQTIGLELYQN